MKKTDHPSEYFLGAIMRAYDTAVSKGNAEPTPSALWDYIVMECMRRRGAFETMFQWDTSTAKSKNRIGTIVECFERNLVPGLKLANDAKGRLVVVREGR